MDKPSPTPAEPLLAAARAAFDSTAFRADVDEDDFAHAALAIDKALGFEELRAAAQSYLENTSYVGMAEHVLLKRERLRAALARSGGGV